MMYRERYTGSKQSISIASFIQYYCYNICMAAIYTEISSKKHQYHHELYNPTRLQYLGRTEAVEAPHDRVQSWKNSCPACQGTWSWECIRSSCLTTRCLAMTLTLLSSWGGTSLWQAATDAIPMPWQLRLLPPRLHWARSSSWIISWCFKYH